MLCAGAVLIFSKFSLAINASLALCISLKLLDITLLENVAVNASTVLLIIDGSLGLAPMANW